MHRTIMSARWAFAALALAIMFATGCGNESADNAAEPVEKTPERSAEEVKADFEATNKAYNSTEDKEEQFKLLFDFLERNPDTHYTFGMLRQLANSYYDEHMGDFTGGIAFVEEHIKRLTGERVDHAMDILIELHGKAGNVDKLRGIASGMKADGRLTPLKHLRFARAFATVKDWGLSIKHAQATLDGATPEFIKAAAGDRELSEEDITRQINNYKGSALLALGHAQAESDDVEPALANFRAAEEYFSFNYVGVSGNNINTYWAKALIKKGDYDAAMRRIAPEAIMQGDDGAVAIFREAYEKSGGGEAGLERAVEAMRMELARPVEDFEAYTYEGEKIAWSELKGRVTLLSFWFPT